jgi:hypothetical protein
MPDRWLDVSVRKVLRPTTSIQVFFHGFPVSWKQMLRWFPNIQDVTTCFSCSPPPPNVNVNFSRTVSITCICVQNHCHRAKAQLQLNKYYYYYYYYKYISYCRPSYANKAENVLLPQVYNIHAAVLISEPWYRGSYLYRTGLCVI